jgi:hypothetical protein
MTENITNDTLFRVAPSQTSPSQPEKFHANLINFLKLVQSLREESNLPPSQILLTADKFINRFDPEYVLELFIVHGFPYWSKIRERDSTVLADPQAEVFIEAFRKVAYESYVNFSPENKEVVWKWLDSFVAIAKNYLVAL